MEQQSHGDVAEHRLEVGMVLENRPRPRVACAEGHAVIEVLERAEVRGLFRAVAGHERPLHLRRVQANRMTAGSYNRAHRDRDDDPDYTMACAMYFTEKLQADHGQLAVFSHEPCDPGPSSAEADRSKYVEAGEVLEEDIVGCRFQVLLRSQEPGFPATPYVIRIEEL